MLTAAMTVRIGNKGCPSEVVKLKVALEHIMHEYGSVAHDGIQHNTPQANNILVSSVQILKQTSHHVKEVGEISE